MGQAKTKRAGWGRPVHTQAQLVEAKPFFCVRSSTLDRQVDMVAADMVALGRLMTEIPGATTSTWPGAADVDAVRRLLDAERTSGRPQGTIIAFEEGTASPRVEVWDEDGFRNAFRPVCGHGNRFAKPGAVEEVALPVDGWGVVGRSGATLSVDELAGKAVVVDNGTLHLVNDPMTMQAVAVAVERAVPKGGLDPVAKAKAYMSAVTNIVYETVAPSVPRSADLRASVTILHDPDAVVAHDARVPFTMGQAYGRALAIYRTTLGLVPAGAIAAGLALASRSTLADLKARSGEAGGRWGKVDEIVARITQAPGLDWRLGDDVVCLTVAKTDAEGASRADKARAWAREGQKIGAMTAAGQSAELHDRRDAKTLIYEDGRMLEVYAWR